MPGLEPRSPGMRLLLALVLILAPQAEAGGCPPIAGFDAVAKPGALVVFGEVHGTREIPAFIGDAACAAARIGRVHVGLELPTEDSGLLATFLAGRGDDGLRQSSFWRSASPYGVTSKAMLALLRRLRAYRNAGAPIDVFFFDDRIHSGLDRRDEGMARIISRERASAPRDLFLVLVGNLHARKSRQWMASFLAGDVTTLDVRSPPGTAWVCLQKDGGAQSCGSQPWRTPAAAAGRGIELVPQPDVGYDGVYRLQSITASPPAFAP